MAVEKLSKLSNTSSNSTASSWLRQLFLFCLCAPVVVPFFIFKPLSCNNIKHDIQLQQFTSDTVVAIGGHSSTDFTHNYTKSAEHKFEGECNHGLLGDLTSLSFWNSPVTYYLIKWDTLEGITHEYIPMMHVTWAVIGTWLMVACHIGTTLFPLSLDCLLRWSCNDASLFTEEEIVKRNNTLYTHPRQVQKHRLWWNNVRTFFLSRVGMQCLYISVLTACQGAVWIMWAMQAGRVSSAAIHVQTLDVQIADWISNMFSTVMADVNLVSPLLSSAAYTSMVLLVWVLRSCFLQVFLMLLLADIASYGYHRLAHENRWLYRVVHSLHHQHYLPHHGYYALQFGAGLDMLFANPCFFIGILLFPNTDGTTLTLFSLSSAALVTAGHTGTDLTKNRLLHWLFHPEFHAAHHQKFTVNYAEHFTIVDSVLGTYIPHAKAQ